MQVSKLIVLAGPRRVERSEEEQLVLQTRNVTSQLAGHIKGAIVKVPPLQVQPAEIIGLEAGRLELLRPEETGNASVKLPAAGLGDDLHQSPGRLSVLRLVA